jgi:DNA-binding winged helix-turn-helix (wHTH) protein
MLSQDLPMRPANSSEYPCVSDCNCSDTRNTVKNATVKIIPEIVAAFFVKTLIVARVKRVMAMRPNPTGISVPDDYVAKPFTPAEVLARIRATLRRAAVLDRNEASGTVNFGNISVNLAARRVFLGASELHLTPNEYKLLQVLLRHSGKVLTQRQLLKEVWGPEHVEDREYLRVFMSQLRHKLEADPAHPKHLITEPGVGYRLLTDS